MEKTQFPVVSRQTYNDLVEKLNEANATIADLADTKAIADKNAQLDALVLDLQNQLAAANAASIDLATANENLAQALQQNESLTAQLSTAQASVSDLTSRLDASVKSANDLTQQLNDLHPDVLAAEDKVKAVRGLFEAHNLVRPAGNPRSNDDPDNAKYGGADMKTLRSLPHMQEEE